MSARSWDVIQEINRKPVRNADEATRMTEEATDKTSLLRVWRDTHGRHRLPVPPGYGAPGGGRAVFSVSAFMDVIVV